MNRSPLTLPRLNKLIGQALRLCQRFPQNANAKQVLKMLNWARRAFKAYNMSDYRWAISLAELNIIFVK